METRLVDAPASLRSRILQAACGGALPGTLSPETLRKMARRLVEEAKSGPPSHDTAMTLLAADALITFSCEVVAEQQPERLAAM
ncbi:MAG: hypothetical protein JSW71_17155 [Gemmatimonadota bacterium]|nr:MAG: hypothetical protein JSW71_17155 [Gemmatimonadota bacterium]